MGQWLIPFAVALVLAYAFHVPTLKISQVLSVSTAVASAIIIAGLMLFVFLVTIFFIPILKNAAFVLMQKLPNILQVLPQYISDTLHKAFTTFGITTNYDVSSIFNEYLDTFILNLPKHIFGFIDTGMTLVYVVIFVFMTPIITFYLLKDWQKFESSCITLLSRFTSPTVVAMLAPINSKLGAYIKGQLAVCLILANAYTISLFFIGVERFVVCGVISGMLAIVPFFGALLGGLTTFATSLNCLSHAYQYLLLVVIYLVVPFLDSNFITPKLIGKKTGIQPVWIIFSICACVSVLGSAGILVSVPIAIVFTTLLEKSWKRSI